MSTSYDSDAHDFKEFERPWAEESEMGYTLPDDTSSATPILGAVMGLSFLTGGVLCAYKAATGFFGGWPLLSPPVLFLGGGAASGLLAAGVVAKLVTWRASEVPEDAPWELRPAWRSPVIEEDLYHRTVSPPIATLFAVAGWGAVLPFFLFSAPAFTLIFPAAFSVPALFTLRRVWHRRRHGTSTFNMDTMPGRLGQTLEGQVQAGVDLGSLQSDAFQVTLTCYHRRPGGGDDTASWRTLCEAETTVQAEATVQAETTMQERATTSSRGPASGRVEIPISFDLPAGVPHSTPEKKPERIAWILEVSAEAALIDYQSYFDIPVFGPEGTTAHDDRPRGAHDDVPEEEKSPTPNVEDPAAGSPSTEETVRCDNCQSTVEASSSTCPACGADLSSDWFS